MFAYIIARHQANNTRKKTKGNHYNSFVYMGSHGAPRAHAYEERSGEVRPGLYEREREYKIIWNYQIICDIFFIFLR